MVWSSHDFHIKDVKNTTVTTKLTTELSYSKMITPLKGVAKPWLSSLLLRSNKDHHIKQFDKIRTITVNNDERLDFGWRA